MSDLPIQFNRTDYLLHPIGEYDFGKAKDKSSYRSSAYDIKGASVTDFSMNRISGNIKNVKFQQVNSDSLKLLTDKEIFIYEMTFLEDIANNTKKQILVYDILDKDTNDNGELDYKDIESLYISNIDGSNFKKLSEENKDVINWKVIESLNRLYFKTVEDTNQNEKLDNEDQFNYYFVNLAHDELTAQEYFPLGN